jgi:hypothetical protein
MSGPRTRLPALTAMQLEEVHVAIVARRFALESLIDRAEPEVVRLILDALGALRVVDEAAQGARLRLREQEVSE